MRRWLGLTCALLLSVGCEKAPATEIVLIFDTDIAGADRLEVEADEPDGERVLSWADLQVSRPPRTLVLLHRGGPLGPIRLHLTALGASGPLAWTRREVSFEEAESLTLRVFLPAACALASCTEDLTCGDSGECRSLQVRPCEYEGRSCGPPDGGSDAGLHASSDGG